MNEERIENKIDKLDERLDTISTTLAAQHESLVYHVKRTDILESQLEPIKKHVAMVSGALKLVGLVGVLGGIVEAVLSVLKVVN